MVKEIPKIESHEIVIEKIDDKHDLNNFNSYEKELVDFLIEDALNNQKQKLSVTFLWFYEKNPSKATLTVIKCTIISSLSPAP